MCTAVHPWCLTLPSWSPLYPCILPRECLSSDPYPALHTEDLHALVSVMQCFGSFGPGSCLGWQKHVWAFCTQRWVRASGGLGCARGQCLEQIPHVWHQGVGRGVSKVCLLLHRAWLSESHGSLQTLCVPQDDQYYHFLAVAPSIYTVNKLHWLIFTLSRKQKCLKEVWTIPRCLCGLLVFCQLFHHSFPCLLCLNAASKKHVNSIPLFGVFFFGFASCYPAVPQQ